MSSSNQCPFCQKIIPGENGKKAICQDCVAIGDSLSFIQVSCLKCSQKNYWAEEAIQKFVPTVPFICANDDCQNVMVQMQCAYCKVLQLNSIDLPSQVGSKNFKCISCKKDFQVTQCYQCGKLNSRIPVSNSSKFPTQNQCPCGIRYTTVLCPQCNRQIPCTDLIEGLQITCIHCTKYSFTVLQCNQCKSPKFMNLFKNNADNIQCLVCNKSFQKIICYICKKPQELNQTKLINYSKPIGIKCSNLACKGLIQQKINILKQTITTKMPPKPEVQSILMDYLDEESEEEVVQEESQSTEKETQAFDFFTQDNNNKYEKEQFEIPIDDEQLRRDISIFGGIQTYQGTGLSSEQINIIPLTSNFVEYQVTGEQFDIKENVNADLKAPIVYVNTKIAVDRSLSCFKCLKMIYVSNLGSKFAMLSPCGCTCCCEECSDELSSKREKCPKCQDEVKGTIKSVFQRDFQQEIYHFIESQNERNQQGIHDFQDLM